MADRTVVLTRKGEQPSLVPAPMLDARYRWTTYAAGVGLVLALVLLAGECALYLSRAAFLDHIESTVVIAGWQYIHGMPIYGIDSGAPHFSAYYGPLTYLAPLPAMLLFGPGISSAKLLFVLAPLLATTVLALHFRNRGAVPTLAALFFLISGLLIFCPITYWLRPDPLETLLVATAVVLGAMPAGAIGVGICLGIVVNLKVHAFLYIIPVLFDLLQRRGWRPTALAVISSLGIFLLPYLAPGISLADYRFALFQQVGTRAADLRLAMPWLVYSLLLAIPLLMALVTASASVTRSDRRYAWAAIGVLALLGYPATFPGAGPYHLLPLMPVLADAFGRLRPRRPVPVLMPFALLVVGVVKARAALVLILGLTALSVEAEEAVQLADANPGISVQVGYGETMRNYQLSQLARTLLSLHGRPAQIDAQVLMELRYVGIDGSRRWVPLVSECREDGWLIPHDETPFAVRSYYDNTPLFDDEFRAAFRIRYHLERTGQNFDLWHCNTEAGSARGG